MLIPSIDLMHGRIVQLVQGERLAIESLDLDGWIRRFSHFPLVQVIDLDAAIGRGDNTDLVHHICTRLPCQVGGGIRSVDRARMLLRDAGAQRVILGSALFDIDAVRTDRAREFADALGIDRVVAAVDSREGMITIHGWKTRTTLCTVDAVAALVPYVNAFLYTHVDTEGTMQGLTPDVVLDIARAAAPRKLIAAGGIRSTAEVDALDAHGIDAVVGMAIYTGAIKP